MLELAAPQDVTVQLLDDGQIRIAWTPGPAGMTAVVHYIPDAEGSFVTLATTDAAQGFVTYRPQPGDGYQYRMQFIQGNDESAWIEATPIATGQPVELDCLLFLPIMQGLPE